MYHHHLNLFFFLIPLWGNRLNDGYKQCSPSLSKYGMDGEEGYEAIQDALNLKLKRGPVTVKVLCYWWGKVSSSEGAFLRRMAGFTLYSSSFRCSWWNGQGEGPST